VLDVALPDALDEAHGGGTRRVDRGVELVRLEVVTAAEAGDPVVLLTQIPRGRRPPPTGT
jgi:hypothetical protein